MTRFASENAHQWLSAHSSVAPATIAVAVGQMTGHIFAVNSTEFVKLEDEKVKAAKAETEKKLRAAGVTGDELAAKLAAREAELRVKLRLQRPFLSANDRSRWDTIRSLVEQGTYQIDAIQSEPGWDTIDMVKHKDRNGEWHLYSSKPPLLATLYAGPYWVMPIGHRLQTSWRACAHTLRRPCSKAQSVFPPA